MIRRSAPTRRTQARYPILWSGTVLVLALVAVLPIALALVSADGHADDVGIGSGAGELSAAALSALHRDLNTKRSGSDELPSHSERLVPSFLAALACTSTGAVAPDLPAHDPTYGNTGSTAYGEPAPSGPGPDGIPLRL